MSSVPRFTVSIGFTAFAFAILVSLGYWQGERLDWKRDLQTQIETRTKAAPLVIRNRAQIARLSEEKHNYHRAKLYGTYGAPKLYWFARAHNAPTAEKIGYHLIQPFILEDGSTIAIDRGFVPASALGKDFIADGAPPEIILRWLMPRGFFAAADDLDNDIVFARDTKTMGAHWRLNLATPLAEIAAPSSAPPYGAQTLLRLSNRHLEYMLTWYGLAAALLIVSLTWHIRALKDS